MKSTKLICFGIISFLLLVGTVQSSPFLISDPQPKDPPGQVEYYMVVIDGVEYQSDPQDLGDGTVRLHYDLVGISSGTHQVEVRAGNIWGESAPVPFGFTKQMPSGVTGIALSGE